MPLRSGREVSDGRSMQEGRIYSIYRGRTGGQEERESLGRTPRDGWKGHTPDQQGSEGGKKDVGVNRQTGGRLVGWLASS